MATEEKVNITATCRQLGYSKQAYYKSLSRKNKDADFRQQIKQKVLAIRHQLPLLGTRKLYWLLKEEFRKQGLKIGRDRLFDLLRQESLLIGSVDGGYNYALKE